MCDGLFCVWRGVSFVFVVVVIFKSGTHYVALAVVELCRAGWPLPQEIWMPLPHATIPGLTVYS